MLDLTVHGGLAAKLVEELCKDSRVLRACSEDIDIAYAEDLLGKGPMGEKILDGTHVGLYTVRNSHSLECYLIKKEYYASSLQSALLVTFSVASKFWEVFDGEPAGEVAAEAKLVLLEEKIQDVFSVVWEEYKKTINSLENSDYVQYKLLSVNGSLNFAGHSAISEIGNFLISYYSDVKKEGFCVAKEGEEISSIIDHIEHSSIAFSNAYAGHVIVWRRIGKDGISASYIAGYKADYPEFRNWGKTQRKVVVCDVETYDYTYESVANTDYFLDFEEQAVKPVSDLANTDTYLGVGFDYNESWMVYADGAHCVSVFDCRAFRTYGAAYDAMNESVAELKVREFYFNKYIGKTSDFGLENIVRHRVRMAAERL